jgi:uncharacterized membrane protein YccC
MFELYCRSGGSISYVTKRTGVNRVTVWRLAQKFKWDSRMRKIADAAEEMSDSALAREMSLATREEIHTFDRVERDLLELMASKKARKYVSYEKLAALLLKVSERRILLRNPAPVKKVNQREQQPALPPGSEVETTTLKLEIERQLKKVGKLAREAGMSEADLEGLDTKKAIDVPASDYEVTKDDEKA